jgi:predicted nucleic acid-binding Zn ribbon protein
MPLYEFVCKKCNKIEESLLNNEEVKALNNGFGYHCSCGEPMERYLSVCSASFQGQGWYKPSSFQKSKDTEG